jgi:hypothetical protein
VREVTAELIRRKDPGEAWNTEADSGAGGGFEIGSSFLALGGLSVTGIPMGATGHRAEWTVVDSAGADIALDADTKRINILTDGWYAWTWKVALEGALNLIQPTLFAGGSSSQIDGFGPLLSQDESLGDYEVTAAIVQSGRSGDAFALGVYGDNSTSTGTYDIVANPTSLIVARLS